MNKIDRIMKEHISQVSNTVGFNALVTVPFVRVVPGTKWFCITEGQVSLAEARVTAFAKALNRHFYGSASRVPKLLTEWLPMIAIPEYRKRDGSKTYVHYHILMLFPEKRWNELSQFSKDWWSEKSLGCDYPGSTIIADVKRVDNAGMVALYSLKHLEDCFTIERMVLRGPLASN